ncbi:hypothetical protein J2S43_004996 [Catenuloplanes nepalensis]|uniref:Uncharacterized protein n=1 Tax=Catenuloplanes nepalensis TaxID=587533 RepID=A0ABT9MYH2_9ACTN|nr:hypothetical protein [Catenuloplanes nepalensis]MDP9796484.1 hypothetical protein [Catenuloplanes nepalensis]
MDGFFQQANIDEVLGLGRTASLTWLAFFAFAMLALFGLSLLSRDRDAVAEQREYRRHRRRHRQRLRAARAVAARAGVPTEAVVSKPLPGETRVSTLDELQRYAYEVATAALRAEQTAARCRIEWEAAERIQQSAWRALQVATEAAERANKASMFPSVVDEIEQSSAEPTADELEERRRHLRRSATRAFHRGEIRYDQLSAVLSFEGEWSPSLSPVEHERSLLRLAQERLSSAYQEATRVERRAWEVAATASAAKTSLAQEATEAELKASLAAAEAAAPKGLAAMLAKVGAVRLPRPGGDGRIRRMVIPAAPVKTVETVETVLPAAQPVVAEDIEATTDLTALTAAATAATVDAARAGEDVEATSDLTAISAALSSSTTDVTETVDITEVVETDPAASSTGDSDGVVAAENAAVAETAKAEAPDGAEVVAATTADLDATVEWEIEASAVVAAAQAEIEAAASRTEDASPEDAAALAPASLPVMGIARVPLRTAPGIAVPGIPVPRTAGESMEPAAAAPTVSARAAVTAPGAVVAGRAAVVPRVVAVVGASQKDEPASGSDDDGPANSTVQVMASR